MPKPSGSVHCGGLLGILKPLTKEFIMWPFVRYRYYFLSYKTYIAGSVGGGWRMRKMKDSPDMALSNLVKEIEAKIGTEIIVTTFYAVR